MQPQPDQRNVRSAFSLDLSTPTRMVLQVAPANRPDVRMDERWEITAAGQMIMPTLLLDAEGGRQHLLDAPAGVLSVAYTGTVTVGVVAPTPVTDAERIIALRPSRYCPSDGMAGFANSMFGSGSPVEKVRAICDWVFEHILYESGSSQVTTDAADTLLTGQGVCRDFAHLVATLARAVQVPARVVAVYAPGLSPMDFHAVVETEIDGVWQVWDATRLAPRQTLIRIATGRDAADVSFATNISGEAVLGDLEIRASSAGDLPLDDHTSLVILA